MAVLAVCIGAGIGIGFSTVQMRLEFFHGHGRIPAFLNLLNLDLRLLFVGIVPGINLPLALADDLVTPQYCMALA